MSTDLYPTKTNTYHWRSPKAASRSHPSSNGRHLRCQSFGNAKIKLTVRHISILAILPRKCQSLLLLVEDDAWNETAATTDLHI